MAEQSEASAEIYASAEEIMAVIADFESFPDWIGSITTADVLTWAHERPETVRIVLASGPISDDCTIRCSWPDDLTMRWRLVDGRLLQAMDGAFELEPLGEDTTTVTHTLSIDADLPPGSPLKETVEQWIADRALRGLKKRVEG